MALTFGLVGLPNAGKSTLFNALTRAGAAVAPYPFTTIDPNVGVVAVPDGRLDQLHALLQNERKVPATIEVVDIAGLVQGASQGEGLGNQFLSHIRTVDAVIVVLRCFADPDVPHLYGSIDPVRDATILLTELALADLALIERRLERLQTAARTGQPAARREVDLLRRLQAHLNAGQPLRTLALAPEEQALLQGFGLLTLKPCLYVANVAEETAPDTRPALDPLQTLAAQQGALVVPVCAALEAELAALRPEEAREYRAALGLTVSGLETLVQTSYRLLNLITFYTAATTREVRAWPVVAGTKAPQAAGRVHSDMERGFIRAEVVSWADLLAAGSLTAARERGLVRLEGRDYVVQDGDVITFRFHV